ncbi:hypothetical protein Tco_0667942 [Tanacetum coccineum]
MRLISRHMNIKLLMGVLDVLLYGSKMDVTNVEAFGMDPNTPADLGVGKFGFAANVTVSVGSKQNFSAKDTKKNGERCSFESG